MQNCTFLSLSDHYVFIVSIRSQHNSRCLVQLSERFIVSCLWKERKKKTIWKVSIGNIHLFNTHMNTILLLTAPILHYAAIKTYTGEAIALLFNLCIFNTQLRIKIYLSSYVWVVSSLHMVSILFSFSVLPIVSSAGEHLSTRNCGIVQMTDSYSCYVSSNKMNQTKNEHYY